MDRHSKDRLFCIIEGDIKEYTEFVEFEALIDEPFYQPIFDDAEFLGDGFYYSKKKI